MTLLTCSHCDGPIRPRRESKAQHGRRRYCSRKCGAAGARATEKARTGMAGDVYALKDALQRRALSVRVQLL